MKNRVLISLSLALALALCLSAPVFSESPRQKLYLGILPEMNVFKQKQRFQQLGAYLSQKTGVSVEFTILRSYGEILAAFKNEKMDGAFFGSFTGALAIRKLGVVPLARPVNLDSTSRYQGYLFVRKDSGIRTIGDMRGKRMAFVSKATTAGYVFPLAYLRAHGVTDPARFFSESFFAGSHDAAITVVLNGQMDIGAAKHSVYERVRARNKRVDQELLILARSAWVPENGLCVRKDLDEGLKKKLKDALLSLHTDPEGAEVLRQFGALRFIDTTTRDYEPVFEMAKKAGIDINTFDDGNN